LSDKKRYRMSRSSSASLLYHLARRLEHAYAVAFRVHKRHVQSDAGDVPRLPKHLAAGFFHFLHVLFYIFDENHHGRILRGFIVRLLEETAIDVFLRRKYFSCELLKEEGD